MQEHVGLLPDFTPRSALEKELAKLLKDLQRLRKKMPGMSIHDGIDKLVKLIRRGTGGLGLVAGPGSANDARIMDRELSVVSEAFGKRWFDKGERQPFYEWYLDADKEASVLARLEAQRDRYRPAYERMLGEAVPGRQYPALLPLYMDVLDEAWWTITFLSMTRDPRVSLGASTGAGEARV